MTILSFDIQSRFYGASPLPLHSSKLLTLITYKLQLTNYKSITQFLYYIINILALK